MSKTNWVIVSYKRLYPGDSQRIDDIALEAAIEAAAMGKSSDEETAEVVEQWLLATL